MLIRQPPFEIKLESHVCDYHKRHPGKQYAGCTCSGTYTAKVKPMKDWTEAEKREYFGNE